MKRFPLHSELRPYLVTFFFVAGVAGAVMINKEIRRSLMTVRTTAYTHTEADHLVYGRKTAIGTILQNGEVNSAAADWSVFPLGTKFKIEGDDTIFEVDDYGSALVGTETIDIYRDSRDSMNDWGVQHVDIEIIEKGSVERSIEVLEKRTAWEHCREMLSRLRGK